jgi:hypothetical protein
MFGARKRPASKGRAEDNAGGHFPYDTPLSDAVEDPASGCGLPGEWFRAESINCSVFSRATFFDRNCGIFGDAHRQRPPEAIHVRVTAATFDCDPRHRAFFGSGIEFVRVQILPGGFFMAPTAVLSETEVLANQKTILHNQTLILRNQEEIKKNQEALEVIVKNQEKIQKNQETLQVIVKNQEKIQKNQETLEVVVKNQEKILAAVRH